MPPERPLGVALRHRPPTRISARARDRSIAAAPINALFGSRSRSPRPGRADPLRRRLRQLPCRRRGAWHALFQDDRRRRFLRRRTPGQRPLPADHRLQPPLHQADEARAARRGALDLGRRRVFVAEARIVDSDGEECARGTGTFLRSHIALSSLAGYRARRMEQPAASASRSIEPARRAERRAVRDDPCQGRSSIAARWCC